MRMFATTILDLDGNIIEAIYDGRNRDRDSVLDTQSSSATSTTPKAILGPPDRQRQLSLPDWRTTKADESSLRSSFRPSSVPDQSVLTAEPRPASSSKKFIGTFLGAAAGAAVLYSMHKSERDSAHKEAEFNRRRSSKPLEGRSQSYWQPRAAHEQSTRERPSRTFSRRESLKVCRTTSMPPVSSSCDSGRSRHENMSGKDMERDRKGYSSRPGSSNTGKVPHQVDPLAPLRIGLYSRANDMSSRDEVRHQDLRRPSTSSNLYRVSTQPERPPIRRGYSTNSAGVKHKPPSRRTSVSSAAYVPLPEFAVTLNHSRHSRTSEKPRTERRRLQDFGDTDTVVPDDSISVADFSEHRSRTRRIGDGKEGKPKEIDFLKQSGRRWGSDDESTVKPPGRAHKSLINLPTRSRMESSRKEGGHKGSFFGDWFSVR